MPDPVVADGELLAAIKGLGGPVLAAVAGLVWRRAEELRHGKRLSWRGLLLDAPCAVGIGTSVGGLALWTDAPLIAAMGFCGLVGHLGTDWLLRELLPRVIEKYLPRPPSDPASVDPAAAPGANAPLPPVPPSP